jgi:hypothetical protein
MSTIWGAYQFKRLLAFLLKSKMLYGDETMKLAPDQTKKGKYSKSTKIACILSQKRSPAMMLAGSCAKTVRQVIGSSRRKMYD